MKNPRMPLKWKIREPQPLPRKRMDPKDRPKTPGITYPRKPKTITDPEKKKRYQDLLDKSRRTKSEKRNYIKGLRTYLHELEADNQIEILQDQRSYIGSMFVDGYFASLNL